EARAAEQDVVAARPHVPHLDGTVEGRGRGLEAQHVRDQAARPRQLEDRAALTPSPRELLERHRRLLARIEEAGALEDEPRLQVEAVLPLERDGEARAGERRERHPRLLLRDVRQVEERAVLDEAARAAVGCLRRDVHPPHEARPVGPEDELPGAGLRDRRGRRQRVRLALAGRALLAPYRLALHVEDRRLGGLLHLDPGARLRAGVDHVRDLAPAPIEEAQVGEVRPAGGEYPRRHLQARQPARRGHEDVRLLREEPAQVSVGPLANQSAIARLIQTKITTSAASPAPSAPAGRPCWYSRSRSQPRARTSSRGWSSAAVPSSAAAGTR